MQYEAGSQIIYETVLVEYTEGGPIQYIKNGRMTYKSSIRIFYEPA